MFFHKKIGRLRAKSAQSLPICWIFFRCVGFKPLRSVKIMKKHPWFYTKNFRLGNMKKARIYGLLRVNIHLVSPICIIAIKFAYQFITDIDLIAFTELGPSFSAASYRKMYSINKYNGINLVKRTFLPVLYLRKEAVCDIGYHTPRAAFR